MNELYDRLVYNLKHFKEWLIWALHDERIRPVVEFVQKRILNVKKSSKGNIKTAKSKEIRPGVKPKPVNTGFTQSTRQGATKQSDFTSARNLTEKQIKEIQMKNAKARLIKSFENGAYVKLYNAFLGKMDHLQEMLAIASNWLVNLPNNIQIAMVSALVVILGIVGMSIIATVPTTLKVKDSLSSMISFKVQVPRIWSTSASTTWDIENFIYPTNSFVESVYNKGKITITYESPKVYAEILGSPTITHIEGKHNDLLNLQMKKFMTAERFIDNYIRKKNSGANEIRIYSKDIMDAKVIDTLKLKQKEQPGKNPYIMPAIVIYSYVQSGARYRELVMTVISSIDREDRLRNQQNQPETVFYRLWKVHFLLSYKARITPYEKYLPVFNKFAQSIQYNNNWLNGVRGTIVELEEAKKSPKPTGTGTGSKDPLMYNFPGQPQGGGGIDGPDFGGGASQQYEEVARMAMTRFRIASRNPVYGIYGIEEPYRTILNNFALNSIIYQYDDYGTTIRIPVKYEFVYRNKNTGDVVGTNDSSYKPSSEYVRLKKRGN